MIIYGNLRYWKSEPLDSASASLRADIKAMEKASDTMATKTIPSSWEGLAPLMAAASRDALVRSLTTHLRGVSSFEVAVFGAANRVRSLTRQVEELDTKAARLQMSINSDGSVSDNAPAKTFESATAAEHYSNQRTADMEAIAEEARHLVWVATDIDSDLVHAIPRDGFSAVEKILEVVDPQVENTWAEFSDEQRRAALRSMAADLAKKYGLEYTLVFEDLEDQDGDGDDDDPDTYLNGTWHEDSKTMRLDINDLDSPQLINTLAHELRHARQHQLVDETGRSALERFFGRDPDYSDLPPGITPSQVDAWRENFKDGNYIELEDDVEGYENQPVERDARDAGSRYLGGLREEELRMHAGRD